MSDKERNEPPRATEATEEPVQDPASDDFEAHRDHAERDGDHGLPNRDWGDGERDRDGSGD